MKINQIVKAEGILSNTFCFTFYPNVDFFIIGLFEQGYALIQKPLIDIIRFVFAVFDQFFIPFSYTAFPFNTVYFKIMNLKFDTFFPENTPFLLFSPSLSIGPNPLRRLYRFSLLPLLTF